MSYWIELHCDAHFSDNQYFIETGKNFCFTDNNDNVMGSSRNTLEYLNKNVHDIIATASKEGWIKVKGKWYCPNCKTKIIHRGS